jgi:hypothetical protein
MEGMLHLSGAKWDRSIYKAEALMEVTQTMAGKELLDSYPRDALALEEKEDSD